MKKLTNKSKKSSKNKPAAATPAGDVVTTLAGEQIPAAELAHIAPALRPFAVKLSTLSRDPNNARLHGEQNIDSIKRSLKRFGQQHLVLFDPSARSGQASTGTIRVGSGRHEAAEVLGWTWIAAAPTNLRGAELKAFALADNRSSELGEWWPEELDRQLEQLKAELPDYDAADVGFTDELLADVPNVKKAHGFAGEPAGKTKSSGSADGGGGGGTGGTPVSQFKIIIDCRDEAHQRELIEEFTNRDLTFSAPSM